MSDEVITEPHTDEADAAADPAPVAEASDEGMIASVEDEDLGPLRMQNLLFRLLGSPGRIRFAGRGLGQDTEEVYAERLGLHAERLAQLRADGVI